MSEIRKLLLIRTNPLGTRSLPYPPIGLLYLAAAVRRWARRPPEIRVVDMGASRLRVSDIPALLAQFRPDAVGFSSMTNEHSNLVRAARHVKTWDPGCLTIVGGPHASMSGRLLGSVPDIDVLVKGEGERTLVELLDSWGDDRELKGIPGVIYRDGDEMVDNGPRPFETDLDALPLPAWDLIDLAPYSRWAAMNGMLAAAPYAPVITSRACPYECAYCHQMFGRKFRSRSSGHVLEELELLRRQFGVRELHLLDDCFNINRRRVLELTEGISSRGFGFRIAFPNGLRSDRLDRELLRALRDAGTYMIYFAIETASPRIQELVRKRLDLDKAAAAIEDAYAMGIIPGGFFMLGFPTETRAEMDRTIRFACESKILKAYFFNVVPFPGTELWNIARNTYPEMPDDPTTVSEVFTFWSSSEFYDRAIGVDLSEVVTDAYRRFYFNPLRVARILRRFPKNIHLLRGALWGFQVWFPAIERLNSLRFR